MGNCALNPLRCIERTFLGIVVFIIAFAVIILAIKTSLKHKRQRKEIRMIVNQEGASREAEELGRGLTEVE